MEAGKKNKVQRSRNPILFFSKKEREFIKEAVMKAEKMTSGEIRVHVSGKISKDLMTDARETFEKIGMTNTKLRNGVLIYFVVKERMFVILGDKGIHEKMGDNLWHEIAEHMQEDFRRNDFTGGIAYGIDRIGTVLKNHFPYQPDDVNELPDEVSIS